jgi:hypothetical protein
MKKSRIREALLKRRRSMSKFPEVSKCSCQEFSLVNIGAVRVEGRNFISQFGMFWIFSWRQ